MEQENCKNIPHESSESSMEYKTMESMESKGIHKNESMGSMIFSGIITFNNI